MRFESASGPRPKPLHSSVLSTSGWRRKVAGANPTEEALHMEGTPRTSHVHRVTRETDVEVTFVVDGVGRAQVSTGIGFLNHMLDSLARHGLFDIDVKCTGDLHVDDHHSVEDVGIALGQALHQALGEGRGIRRMGHAIVPLDEALSMVAVDISGRGVAAVTLGLEGPMVGDMKAQMVAHFFQSLAMDAKMS